MRQFACAVVVTVFAAGCQNADRRASEPPVWFDFVWAFVMGHDTRYTPGLSDAGLNALEIGMSEAEVVHLLGNPFSERWIYGASYPDACDVLIFFNDRLAQVDRSMESCRSIGIRAGMSTAEVRVMKGNPAERNRMYFRSPGDRNYWKHVVVTTSNGAVTEIRGRVYAE
jgi:hypothetical protein